MPQPVIVDIFEGLDLIDDSPSSSPSLSASVSESVSASDSVSQSQSQSASQSPSGEVSLVEELRTALGVDGEYDDSVEGLQQMVEKASSTLAQQHIDQVFGSVPELKRFYDFVMLGGEPSKFIQHISQDDYSKIEFKEGDERQHEQIVRAELTKRGLSPEEINEEIEDFKNGGILESKAKRALSSLKVIQEKERAQIVEQQRQAAENDRLEAEKYWNGVKETITKKSELKGLTLPATDKDAFFAYLTKPVKDGKTKRDLDAEALDQESLLAMDYLLYKGFKLGDLVTKKAKDLNAASLRDRLSRKAPAAQAPNRKPGQDVIVGI